MSDEAIAILKLMNMKPPVNHVWFCDHLKSEEMEFKMRGGEINARMAKCLRSQREKIEFEVFVDQLPLRKS